MEFVIFGAIATWWTFAVTVFAVLTYEQEGECTHRMVVAVFWPLFAILGLPVVLWRIPFKTAKAMRVDLRNRRLLREFEDWLVAKRSESKETKG